MLGPGAAQIVSLYPWFAKHGTGSVVIGDFTQLLGKEPFKKTKLLCASLLFPPLVKPY